MAIKINDYVITILLVVFIILLVILIVSFTTINKSCMLNPYQYSANQLSKQVEGRPVVCWCSSPNVEPFIFSSNLNLTAFTE